MKRLPPGLVLMMSCALISGVKSYADDFGLNSTQQDWLSGIYATAKTVGASSQSGMKFLSVSTTVLAQISQYPVRGLDVSHHNNDAKRHHRFQWNKVKDQGFSFVFIKATEGMDIVDDDFYRNWDGAKKAKLVRGAYQFYNFCDRGFDKNGNNLVVKQAQLFIATVPRDRNDLPPTIDFEVSKSCPDKQMPNKQDFRRDLLLFLAMLEARYGKDKTPILYMGTYIYDTYFKGENDKNPIWFTEPHQEPQLSGQSWTFWQYAYHGYVDGVGDEVDLDVFHGSPEQFAAWRNPGAGVSANPPAPKPAAP